MNNRVTCRLPPVFAPSGSETASINRDTNLAIGVFSFRKIGLLFIVIPERTAIPVSEEPDLSTLLAVLDDEYARDILTHTSVEPMSASTLSERCDASLPTIYRRLDRLEECHLVTEETELAPDGNHYSVYSANLDRLELSLEDGSFALELTYSEEDVADKFTRMWEGMR